MTLETPSANGRRRRNWRAGRNPQKGFALVEKMFYYYHRIKKAVDITRAEQGYYQGGGRTGGGSSNHAFVSDPTATIAMKHYQPLGKVIINADRINEEVIASPEKWLTIVEQTFMHFDDEPMATSCIDLGLSYGKYYKLRDIGVDYALKCAIQLGVIKVFE